MFKTKIAETAAENVTASHSSLKHVKRWQYKPLETSGNIKQPFYLKLPVRWCFYNLWLMTIDRSLGLSNYILIYDFLYVQLVYILGRKWYYKMLSLIHWFRSRVKDTEENVRKEENRLIRTYSSQCDIVKLPSLQRYFICMQVTRIYQILNSYNWNRNKIVDSFWRYYRECHLE